MKHPKRPCHECPFRRDVKPGTLGGSPVTTFVGQSIGPFVLNCHLADGYTAKPEDALSTPQCAGAAIYRANLGVELPRQIHTLPADDQVVFASHAEFVAHHEQVSIEIAQQLLELFPAKYCLLLELQEVQRTR